MWRFSPRRTDGQRRMLSAGVVPRWKRSRTMRRISRRSEVLTVVRRSIGSVVCGFTNTRNTVLSAIPGNSRGCRPWMPSMSNTSPGPSEISGPPWRFESPVVKS
jgi:hypothetical protein